MDSSAAQSATAGIFAFGIMNPDDSSIRSHRRLLVRDAPGHQAGAIRLNFSRPATTYQMAIAPLSKVNKTERDFIILRSAPVPFSSARFLGMHIRRRGVIDTLAPALRGQQIYYVNTAVSIRNGDYACVAEAWSALR